jgi:hypothetical protein
VYKDGMYHNSYILCTILDGGKHKAKAAKTSKQGNAVLESAGA